MGSKLGNKPIAWCFVLIITLFSALADADVKVTPIKDQIIINEIAIFNITIQNNYVTEETFRIRNFDYPIWDIATKPLTNPITVEVPPKSSKTLKLFIKPLQPNILTVGSYSVNGRVESETRDLKINMPLTVSIKSTEPLIGGYLPNVRVTVNVPEKIDPREESKISVTLKNLNPISYDNVTVTLSSDLINEETRTTLEGPGEGTITNPESEKTLRFPVKFDPMLEPREEEVRVEVFFNKRKLDSQTRKYKVIEYFETEEIPAKSEFLKSTQGIKLISNNPNYRGTATLKTTVFRNLFTSTDPDSQFEEALDGKGYLTWDVQLDGKNEAEVYATTNFRPLAVIILLILILLALYFVLRSPITLNKGISNIGLRHGGISELKVMIKIKNRGKKEIEHIEISDSVPLIVEFEKDLTIGSIHPTKLARHAKHGTIIKWYMEKLEPKDERVLTYKIKTRLPILGELVLSPASARCRLNKKNIITSSNRAIASI